MRNQRKHFLLTTLLLIILSIGTVYDPCAQEEWRMAPSFDAAPFLLTDAPASLGFSSGTDCHCLCHFFFQPSTDLLMEGSAPHQPAALSLKESLKEPPISGIFRPPISLL